MSEDGERILACAREALAFAKGDQPAEAITINGHRYISEKTLASWGTIEVMVRNPAVSEAISDLEARLEKARKVIEPFAMDGWADEHGWTERGCPRDRICDWLGPSDFRVARAWMEQNDE